MAPRGRCGEGVGEGGADGGGNGGGIGFDQPPGLHPPHSWGYSRRATFRQASPSVMLRFSTSHAMRKPQRNWGCLPHSVSENTAGARVLRTASVQELTPHVNLRERGREGGDSAGARLGGSGGSDGGDGGGEGGGDTRAKRGSGACVRVRARSGGGGAGPGEVIQRVALRVASRVFCDPLRSA